MATWVHLNPEPGIRARVIEADAQPGPNFAPMTEAELSAWVAQQPPLPPPAAPVYRVSKDTIYARLKAAGFRSAMNAFLRALQRDDPDEYEEFTQSNWFSSDNPKIRGVIQGFGANVDDILAPDPML